MWGYTGILCTILIAYLLVWNYFKIKSKFKIYPQRDLFKKNKILQGYCEDCAWHTVYAQQPLLLPVFQVWETAVLFTRSHKGASENQETKSKHRASLGLQCSRWGLSILPHPECTSWPKRKKLCCKLGMIPFTVNKAWGTWKLVFAPSVWVWISGPLSRVTASIKIRMSTLETCEKGLLFITSWMWW